MTPRDRLALRRRCLAPSVFVGVSPGFLFGPRASRPLSPLAVSLFGTCGGGRRRRGPFCPRFAPGFVGPAPPTADGGQGAVPRLYI